MQSYFIIKKPPFTLGWDWTRPMKNLEIKSTQLVWNTKHSRKFLFRTALWTVQLKTSPLKEWLITRKLNCSEHFENISKLWELSHQNRRKSVHSFRKIFLFSFATSKCSLRYWHSRYSRRTRLSISVSIIMHTRQNYCAYLLLHHSSIKWITFQNWSGIAKNSLKKVSRWDWVK